MIPSIGLLKNRKFLNIWFAQICSQFAFGTLTVGIAVLADQGKIVSSLQGLSLSTSLVIFVAAIPGAFLGPVAGIFSDWYDKKMIMFYSNFLRFLLAVILVIFWAHGPFPYILLLLLSIVGQFFFPAEGSSIPLLVEKKDILLANTFFALTQYSAIVIGFFSAGLLLSLFSETGFFLICTILFLAATILVLFLPSSRVNYDSNPKISFNWQSLKEVIEATIDSFKGIKDYIFSNKYVLHVIIHLFIVNVIIWTILSVGFRITQEILYITDSYGMAIGVVLPLAGGLIVGLVWMHRYKKDAHRKALITLGVRIATLGLLIVASCGIIMEFFDIVNPMRLLAIAGIFIVGLSGVYLVIPAQAMLNEQVDTKYLGRVYGIWLAAVISVASFPPVVLSLLADSFNNIANFLIIIAVIMLGYSLFVKKLFKV